MAITAGLVKELRERTGSGMMECKKALVETDGDIEAAIDLMRKSGAAKADKKSGRTAAEGLITFKSSGDNKNAVMVEINCETDFVTKGEDFLGFASAVAQTALDQKPADIDALLATPLDGGENIADATKTLIAKVGENMNVRRFVSRTTDGVLGAREKEIFSAQAAESGKPPEIVEKMVGGRIKKFLKEITLLNQPFVKDPDQTVGQLVDAAGATVVGFDRLEVGEGIEKKVENFAEEVMAQAQGS